MNRLLRASFWILGAVAWILGVVAFLIGIALVQLAFPAIFPLPT